MSGFLLFLFKLSLVIAGFLLAGKLWPEEARKFPLRNGAFFYIPVVANNDWKFNLFMGTLITLNIFLTVRFGKDWSDGKRAMLFFLLLIGEVGFLTPLVAYLTHHGAPRLPLRTSSSPASP